MHKTLFIDVPGLTSYHAHRQVVATLTHYGFQVSQASTEQNEYTARVTVTARQCAGDHEGAGRSVVSVLPPGARLTIDDNSPFMQ
jgi:hypothetical protein